MQMPTPFQDELEHAELHSAQLVDVEITIYHISQTGKRKQAVAVMRKLKLQKSDTTKLSPLPFFPVSFR